MGSEETLETIKIMVVMVSLGVALNTFFIYEIHKTIKESKKKQ
jgi:hypothetical protein